VHRGEGARPILWRNLFVAKYLCNILYWNSRDLESIAVGQRTSSTRSITRGTLRTPVIAAFPGRFTRVPNRGPVGGQDGQVGDVDCRDPTCSCNHHRNGNWVRNHQTSWSRGRGRPP